jgi:hypothetical protein
MTWTMKIAVAGALLAIPAAAVSFPAYAAPPPADPPTIAPQPPPQQPSQGEYYNPQDPNDWWPYAGTGSF